MKSYRDLRHRPRRDPLTLSNIEDSSEMLLNCFYIRQRLSVRKKFISVLTIIINKK